MDTDSATEKYNVAGKTNSFLQASVCIYLAALLVMGMVLRQLFVKRRILNPALLRINVKGAAGLPPLQLGP